MNNKLTINEIGPVINKSPVFISSLYRSSSTFVAAILSCNKKYFAMSSAVKYLRFCYQRYCPILDSKNAEQLIDETFKRVNQRWNISFDLNLAKDISAENGGGYGGLYDGIMTSIGISNGLESEEWVEKIAVMWTGIPHFLKMFPRGKVLHIHRDPRSIMASYKKMTNEPGFAYLDTAFNFLSSVQEIKNYKREFGQERILDVRSEDIAYQPEETLRKICLFLETDFDANMLDPNKNAFLLGEQWQTNTSFRNKVEGFPKPHQKWKEYLDEDEILFLQIIAQPYLSELGYETSAKNLSEKTDLDLSNFLKDEYIQKKFSHYWQTGRGTEGYRTDPWLTEMKIVFPERFI